MWPPPQFFFVEKNKKKFINNICPFLSISVCFGIGATIRNGQEILSLYLKLYLREECNWVFV